ARAVMRHALVWVVVIITALAVLGAPFIGVHWGGIGTWVLPQDAPTHIPQRKRVNEFGGPTSSANIVMRNAQRSQVLGYVIAIRAIDGVTDAVVKKRVRQSVLLHVSWHGKAQSRQSRDIVTA